MFNFSKKGKLRKELKRLRDQVAFTLHADDDILSQQQIDDLNTLGDDLKNVSVSDVSVVKKSIDDGNERIRKIVPRKRFSTIREYADILAVAMAVAFGIRGLFLQPFKIPTSSMQPTLFGIHYIAKEGNHNPLLGKVPILDFPLFSCRKAEMTVKEEGTLDVDSIRQYTSNVIFSNTALGIGDISYTLPGKADKVLQYTGLRPEVKYPAGYSVVNGWLSEGDHLFVDRFSMHLTGLNRGDVVVFNTEGIYADGEPLAANGYYYIKRLVGLPGDTLKISSGRLYIKPLGKDKFEPANKFSKKFDKVYSQKGGYHGHLNVMGGDTGEYLYSGDTEFTVPKDSYFMLGDNSYFSSDSRRWGVVPRKNIVGKAFFVFWPFSRRWGVVDRLGPLPENTQAPERGTFKAMHLQ
jgi:signal peptidase I